jgi:putative transposase
LARPPSRRAIRDAELVTEIHAAREGYRHVYGVRKTWKQLRRRGITDAGRERVARLMRQEGLRGVQRVKKRRTTTPDETARDRARDLVNRDFTATKPDQLWVADLTYVRTWQGFAYLAFILDMYARMIVGWQLAAHMRSDLVVDAFGDGRRAAPANPRWPGRPHGSRLAVHQPALHRPPGRAWHRAQRRITRRRLRERDGRAWVATYKTELVAGRLWSFERLEHETLTWISFYNHERLHEKLGDVPPVEYEQLTQGVRPRPCGPPETSQPALTQGALAGLGRIMQTTKQSL